MNSTEQRILTVTSLGHLLSHYNMAVFPALVIPLTASLHLSMAQVLGLSFWHYLLFGISALPWGLAGDRWGGNFLMTLMFVGAGASGLAAALCIGSPWGLSVSLAALGLFSGVYHPIGLGLISKGVTRLNMAMGYNAMFGGLGMVLAPLVSGVATWLGGPGVAYAVVAVANLSGLVLMALYAPGRPHEHAHEESDSNNGFLGAFLILLVAMMLGGMAYTGSTVVLPAYLELKSRTLFEFLGTLLPAGVSGNLMATAIVSLIYLVGMIGQYVGGVVGERYEARFLYLIFHAVCIPTAFLMAYAQDLPLAGLGTIYFFFLLGMQPVENTLVARLTPKKLHHSAYGMKFILTFGVGSLAVKIVGWIGAKWGTDMIFVALGFTSVMIVASIVLLIYWTNRYAEGSKSVAVPAAAGTEPELLSNR